MKIRTSPVSDLAVLHKTLCTLCISERYYAQITYSQQIKIVLASFVHYSFRTRTEAGFVLISDCLF
jgi:hypothetical protein